ETWQRMSVKQFFLTMLTSGMTLLSACAGERGNVVLSPVGPAPAQKPASQDEGTLVVYSAFDPHPDFTATDPDRRIHTDYKVYSFDAKLLKTVHNDTGQIVEGRVEGRLPAGQYKVQARANGYGLVTVPVVVATGRRTSVHLEGG